MPIRPSKTPMDSMTNDSSMAVKAYAAIKKRILDFRYVPGERLSEVNLAKELGLGRSPIRTALAKLKSDGWIAVSPQSGTFIRSLNEQEIQDLLDLRLLLETHVTELAAQRIGDDELRKLRRAFVAFRPTSIKDLGAAFNEFNEFDSLFHLTLYRVAGNALITEILTNLLDKVQWLKTTTLPSAERIRSSFAELNRILEALEARDPKAAATRMREHIGNAATFAAEARGKTTRAGKASQTLKTISGIKPPRGRRAA
jgi:GntR family transcriptional regulator, rspAB operon transcriptional repressor